MSPPVRPTVPAHIFAEGERVPDWLLTVEPIGRVEGAQLGCFVFLQRCAVITVDERHFVLPLDKPESDYFLTAAVVGCAQIKALENDVYFMNALSMFAASEKAVKP